MSDEDGVYPIHGDKSDTDEPETHEERLQRMRDTKDELLRRRRSRGEANIPDRRPQPDRQLEAFDIVAYTSKITYNGRGDVVWTVVIPHQYHEMADELPKTYRTPLHVTIAKWRPLDAVRTGE